MSAPRIPMGGNRSYAIYLCGRGTTAMVEREERFIVRAVAAAVAKRGEARRVVGRVDHPEVQASPEAVALRVAAQEFWIHPPDPEWGDPDDKRGQERWVKLARAAIRFTRGALIAKATGGVP